MKPNKPNELTVLILALAIIFVIIIYLIAQYYAKKTFYERERVEYSEVSRA